MHEGVAYDDYAISRSLFHWQSQATTRPNTPTGQRYIEQAGLLDSLVFQGGTSLRLSYGGNRFSEDLDFAGGYDFSSSQLAEMKACIETYFRRI